MSSLNNTNGIATALNAINWSSMMFTRFWCIRMFILGFIGHSLNMCVFTRPKLHLNPCARHFIALAITGYAVIFIILPIRLLQFGYSRSLFIAPVAMCKFLTYLFSCIRFYPTLHFMLRFFCSSLCATVRTCSSIRVSNRLNPLEILTVSLTQIPMLNFYTISSQPTIRLGQHNLFQKLNGFSILVVWSLISSSVMLVFGIFTSHHIKQSTRTVASERTIKIVDRNELNPLIVN
ncbi:unnamed protein product [Rotaria magnacalcarata]